MTMQKYMAEQATGCRENPAVKDGGPLYDDNGNQVSDTAARALFMNGEAIHAPNAGAGSYTAILRRLGFKYVGVEDWTSIAGDWVFRVWNKRLVFQSNRYPKPGFSYTIANEEDCT